MNFSVIFFSEDSFPFLRDLYWIARKLTTPGWALSGRERNDRCRKHADELRWQISTADEEWKENSLVCEIGEFQPHAENRNISLRWISQLHRPFGMPNEIREYFAQLKIGNAC